MKSTTHIRDVENKGFCNKVEEVFTEAIVAKADKTIAEISLSTNDCVVKVTIIFLYNLRLRNQ